MNKDKIKLFEAFEKICGIKIIKESINSDGFSKITSADDLIGKNYFEVHTIDDDGEPHTYYLLTSDEMEAKKFGGDSLKFVKDMGVVRDKNTAHHSFSQFDDKFNFHGFYE